LKTLKSSRDGAEKNRERKEKGNLQKSLQIKGKLTFGRRNTLQLQKSFSM
jgi:hypothetical protein